MCNTKGTTRTGAGADAVARDRTFIFRVAGAVMPAKFDKYRADAETWLSRAALMPANSWERERLTAAAMLNYALVSLVERRQQHSGSLGKAQSRPLSVSTTEGIPASFSGES